MYFNFIEYRDSFITTYLQKHIVVILFWYKYKTIKYFLRSLENLIYFQTISFLRRVFLILLVRVIVGFVSFPIRIIGEVFLIRRVTFLEKFDKLCSLTSYLSKYHDGYYRNRCYSLVIVLVSVLLVSCGFSFPPG